jgi:hypothetical protein
MCIVQRLRRKVWSCDFDFLKSVFHFLFFQKLDVSIISLQFAVIILRERVANRSQRVSIRHQFVDNIVHDFDHELESRSLEMKSDQNQEKKEKLASEVKYFFRILIDFATNRVEKQYGKLSRQKLVSE